MTKALILVVLLTGCSLFATPGFEPAFGAGNRPCERFTTTSFADFAVGAVAGTISVVLAATAAGGEAGEGAGAAIPILGLGGVAVIGGASGLFGLHERGRCRDAQRDFDDKQRAAAEAKAHREQAWQLTQEAQAAARADDCARVRVLAAQIASLDAGVHDSVFARDVAVARCLAAPR